MSSREQVSRWGIGCQLAGQVLAIVAVVTLSFLVELTMLGDLGHDRAQAQLLGEFRSRLALATAPVGPLDAAQQPLATGTPVALLDIPKLHLREVVVEGTSSGPLMSGPGHRRDTPLPGQAGGSVIVGRRATYGAPFRSVDQLRPRDRFTVTTGQGTSSYTVLGLRRAGDPLPPAPAGGSRLTLITTDGPALRPTGLLRVDTALLGNAFATPAQLPRQALPASDAALAGDSSALLEVVEWAVLLVAAALGVVWLRYRAGPWQAWVIGLPVLIALGLLTSDQLAALLPNLI